MDKQPEQHTDNPQKKCRGSSDKIVQQIIHRPPAHNDPNGSYTGVPFVPGEVPVQDADDL